MTNWLRSYFNSKIIFYFIQEVVMESNVRYIVTKASDDTTFKVGDHIKLLSDGAILCIEAKGWIDASDVPTATQGIEYEADKEWVEKGRRSAIALLETLDKLEEL
jgi:hypothetical protein